MQEHLRKIDVSNLRWRHVARIDWKGDLVTMLFFRNAFFAGYVAYHERPHPQTTRTCAVVFAWTNFCISRERN